MLMEVGEMSVSVLMNFAVKYLNYCTQTGFKKQILFYRNPALEDQACDRIYRVGQHRDVTIHR